MSKVIIRADAHQLPASVAELAVDESNVVEVVLLHNVRR